MSLATIIEALFDAGASREMIVAAVRAHEAEQKPTAETARQARNRRYYEAKKASESRLKASEGRLDGLSSSEASESAPPNGPLSPNPSPPLTPRPSSLRSDLSSGDDAPLLRLVEPDGPDDVQTAFEAFNAVASEIGIPKARELTSGRRTKLRKLLRARGLPLWLEALERLRDSPHCRGENDRGWKADLDFMLQDKSFNRLIEGSYGGNRNGTGSGTSTERRGKDRVDRLRRSHAAAMRALHDSD